MVIRSTCIAWRITGDNVTWCLKRWPPTTLIIINLICCHICASDGQKITWLLKKSNQPIPGVCISTLLWITIWTFYVVLLDNIFLYRLEYNKVICFTPNNKALSMHISYIYIVQQMLIWVTNSNHHKFFKLKCVDVSKGKTMLRILSSHFHFICTLWGTIY